MTDRPILFSAPMIRAILDGRKTQTRRIVKPQPAPHETWDWSWPVLRPGVTPGTRICWRNDVQPNLYPYCPHGHRGDRLWVRETVQAFANADGTDRIRYLADGAEAGHENTREGAERWMDLYHYRKQKSAKVPAIRMPRWASRITLEITEVRVERLQAISEADALAEGIIEYDPTEEDPAEYAWDEERGRGEIFWEAAHAFKSLWRSINGAGSWDANPWVWAISFRRAP